MTHMLRLSLMSHGKITVFTASMQARQFQNIVPDAVMRWMEAPFHFWVMLENAE